MRRHRTTTRAAILVALAILAPPPPAGARNLAERESLLAASASWTTVGSMLEARASHTATLLQNGKVLVAGGFTDEFNHTKLSSAELYDPTTGTWSATGDLTIARYRHTATLLQNGKVLVAGGYSDDILATADLYDPATGTWSATGDLTIARSDHTATLLQNGKVLVAGGSDINGADLASAELYDPASGTWSVTGSMINGRSLHTTTLLNDGRVLVSGGLASGYSESPEVYDPAAGTWSTTGDLNNDRYSHTAILLPDGKVLVAGGYGGSSLISAEQYDPATGQWTLTGSPTHERWVGSATLLPNGKVLVVGGGSDGFHHVKSTDLYDPATGQWTPSASLSAGRFQHTATLLPGGTVLVAGGAQGQALLPISSAEIYDPAAGTWSPGADMGALRYGHTATLLPNGKVLAAGGLDALAGVTTAEVYDPTTETWSATGAMPTEHALHTATLLFSGKVLVVGGRDSSSPSSRAAELYDPDTGTWSATGSMSATRESHTATLLPDGRVLVTGGRTTWFGGVALATAEVYNPATGTWSVTSSMAAARSSHTAILLTNGKVLVAGGVGVNAELASAELYDPTTGTWSATGSMGAARESHTITLLPNGAVIVAGGRGAGASLSSAELYNPAAGTWSASGAMTAAHGNHTATLLSGGRVLVAGGHDSTPTAIASAEVYEPATGRWSSVASLATARGHHTATLLPSGKVLVSGGTDGSGVHTSAELYDAVPGFDPARQPLLTTVTSPLIVGDSLVATGSRFHGKSEGSDGTSQNSSTNYPLVQLRSLGNEQTRFLPLDAASGWSDTAFTSTPVTDFPLGYAIATVFVNGIPSESGILLVQGCPNVLQFSASSYSVTESGGSVTITVTKTGACDATVDYLVASNTATTGPDFTATSGTLSFAAAQTTRTFTVTIANDAIEEGNESINLTLTQPVDGSLGQNRHAVITILDDDSAGTLQFSAANYNVSEASVSTTITVTRTGGSAGAVSVPWTLASNIAVTGLDTQSATAGTLSWAAGDSASKTFTVTTKEDALVEGNEQLHLFLGAPGGGATLGNRRRSAVTILDNDVPPGGFAFSTQSYTVGETGSATITITRTGAAAPQSVTFTASNNGTATAGQDFTWTSVVVAFAANQSSRTVTVPILADALAEGDESVNLSLSAPTAGGTLAAQRRAVLTILDDDASGALQFLAPSFAFDETAGAVTIQLSRTGGSAGAVGVTFSTGSNIATSGADFQAVSTTVTFSAGVTTASVTVPIVNDTRIEGAESLNLTLSGPTGGATLASGRRAVLVIVDDDVP